MTEQEEFEFRLRLEQEQAAPAEKPKGPSLGPNPYRMATNALAGAVRGAGSIGATLLAPLDYAEDFLRSKVTGQPMQNSNAQRRADMTAALGTMGADTDSLAFGAGKLGGEVAGTLGAGPGVAAGLRMTPLATKAAPLVSAIETAGMRAGGMAGARALPVRMAGGAVNGGVAAGMVNPEEATSGAAIGLLAPPALMAAGKSGATLGGVLRGPAQTPELAQAVQTARGAGYVIPPTQAKPTLGNRVLEGFSGKITTAQNASAKNQAVTNDLAAKALGLPPGTQITPTELANIRTQAGRAYQAIGATGAVTPTAAYSKALDNIAAPFVKASQGFPGAKPSPVLELVDSLRSPSFDAASAVEKVKQLRTQADDAFRSGNTDIGRAARSAAKALEDTLETHLQTINQPQLLQQFKDARQLIAKTYTVEKALNPASGSVDARKLAAELKKGKPLSGDLRTAGEFGLQFPKAAQTIEGMGSLPQTSPLDWAMGGSLSAMTANPLMMAGVAARPMARSAVLSPVVQNRLVQRPSYVGNALMNPELQQAVLRAAPLLPGQRQ